MTRKEKTDKLRSIRRWLLDILIIIAGSGVYALGVHCFTAPNNIAPGGDTGIPTIISYETDHNVGTLITAINLPLLIVWEVHFFDDLTPKFQLLHREVQLLFQSLEIFLCMLL